jgi:hypothetical protein
LLIGSSPDYGLDGRVSIPGCISLCTIFVTVVAQAALAACFGYGQCFKLTVAVYFGRKLKIVRCITCILIMEAATVSLAFFLAIFRILITD